MGRDTAEHGSEGEENDLPLTSPTCLCKGPEVSALPHSASRLNLLEAHAFLIRRRIA